MHRRHLERLARLSRGAAVLSLAGSAACANSGSTTNAPIINGPASITSSASTPPPPVASLTPPPPATGDDGPPLPVASGTTSAGRPHWIPINAPPRPIIPPSSSGSQP